MWAGRGRRRPRQERASGGGGGGKRGGGRGSTRDVVRCGVVSGGSRGCGRGCGLLMGGRHTGGVRAWGPVAGGPARGQWSWLHGAGRVRCAREHLCTTTSSSGVLGCLHGGARTARGHGGSGGARARPRYLGRLGGRGAHCTHAWGGMRGAGVDTTRHLGWRGERRWCVAEHAGMHGCMRLALGLHATRLAHVARRGVESHSVRPGLPRTRPGLARREPGRGGDARDVVRPWSRAWARVLPTAVTCVLAACRLLRRGWRMCACVQLHSACPCPGAARADCVQGPVSSTATCCT